MRRIRSVAAQDGRRVLRPIWRAELADHVVSLSWSGDSRLVAAAAVSGAVAVFDGATGALRWRAKAHEVGTCALALRPQGDLLATGGQDGVIRLFDADGGAVKAELPGGAPWVVAPCLEPERLLWAPAQDAEPRARAALGSAVSQLAWAPDDQSIAVGSAEGRVAAYRGVV